MAPRPALLVAPIDLALVLAWPATASQRAPQGAAVSPVAALPNPTGVEFPWWVAGTADDIAYTSLLEPNLGGRQPYKLGHVATVHRH